jgi:glycerol kinase
VDPYFSATKLEWLLQQPSIRERIPSGQLLAGTIDSWLVWKLTNGAVHATDFTNASRTMLFDIHVRAWSSRLLSIFGVPASMLPEVRKSSGAFGDAQREHFGTAIPILGVAGDQQAALMGQGGWSAGLGKNTYGTGAFLLLNTGERKPSPGDGLLTTLACDENGNPCYALEASIFIAGAAVQWLRDGLGIIEVAAESESMAQSLASNDGVYFVTALTGLGAPYWESEARGLIAGLTRGTTRAHIVRAAVEAMAYGTADVLDAMRKHGQVSFDMLRVDGGAATNNWLMQFQSDLLGVPVERPDLVETTAFGAAGLAGLAGGVWRDANRFLASRRFTRFQPTADRAAVLHAYAGWHRAVRATVSHARDRA